MEQMVSVKEAKAEFSEMVNRAAYGQERIVITSRGRAKAALISIDDLRRLEQMELKAESEMLARAIEETSDFQPLETVMAELLDAADAQ